MACANEDLNRQQEILDTSDTCLLFACEFVTFIRSKLILSTIRFPLTLVMNFRPLLNPEVKECLEKCMPSNISVFYKKLKKRCSKEPEPSTEAFFEEKMDEILKVYFGTKTLPMQYTFISCLGVYADVKGLNAGLGLATCRIQESLLHEVQQKYPDLDRIGVHEICQLLQNNI